MTNTFALNAQCALSFKLSRVYTDTSIRTSRAMLPTDHVCSRYAGGMFCARDEYMYMRSRRRHAVDTAADSTLEALARDVMQSPPSV